MPFLQNSPKAIGEIYKYHAPTELKSNFLLLIHIICHLFRYGISGGIHREVLRETIKVLLIFNRVFKLPPSAPDEINRNAGQREQVADAGSCGSEKREIDNQKS